MQLHQLRPKHKLKKRKRVGRGGKRGTYSGRGSKGQRSRAGRKFKPAIRELIKRYPKLRGYKFKRVTLKPAIVNIETLEKRFSARGESAGEKSEIKINPQTLLEQKIIRKIKGRMPMVKILGSGKLTRALIVEDCQVSKSAREKIEKAGGRLKTKNKNTH
jgi:large subunit ribosomal protein L15